LHRRSIGKSEITDHVEHQQHGARAIGTQALKPSVPHVGYLNRELTFMLRQ
jgi:hypothetical protein